MSEIKKTTKKQVLPVLPLRGLTVFPYMVIHFDVGREKSVKALEEAMVNNQLIFLTAQMDIKEEEPTTDSIYKVGTISKVKQLLKLPGDTIRVLVEGISRGEITDFVHSDPFFMAKIREVSAKITDEDTVRLEALKRQALEAFEDYAKLSNRLTPDTIMSVISIQDPAQLADVIAGNVILKTDQKQEILGELDIYERLEKLIYILVNEIEIVEVEKNVASKVRRQIDKLQKEYYLREQLKVIQSELGEKEGILGEVEDYKGKLEKMELPDEVKQKFLKELDRLSKMQQGSAEGSVIRTYLDWLLDLPWNNKTEANFDVERAGKILDEDHYGLEKVKDRILEYLAVTKLKNSLKGPILCLVGPPGVGKTSIAKSIARALNRKYVRMSLGGVRDEAEIRGHRRTYVGAMPGRIITALKQAGSKNPLILLDEIDKMSNDFRGDPSAALLEVLDSEQNFSFRDHYIELPFDLSDVMFLTTANSLDTIPRPLLDRMEIISLTGYTAIEKVNIASKYLIPKQLEAHGLKKSSVKIDEQVIIDLINFYTREAGVRTLERQIGSLCRKVARELVSTGKKSMKISSSSLEKLLGKKIFRYDLAEETDQVGIATGMAWTPVGGDTLAIEVVVIEGNGKIHLTGQLGDVMKESAETAISYIRSRADEFGIDKNFNSKYDIHVHVPEGAIPKDGPSAGITLATAVISALTGIPVRHNVSMTGEVTLRGRVLPIGGLKEKVLAAHRAGIDTIICPMDNLRDIDDISEAVRKELKFVTAANMDTVLETALVRKPEKKVDQEEKAEGKEDSTIIPPSVSTPNSPKVLEQ